MSVRFEQNRTGYCSSTVALHSDRRSVTSGYGLFVTRGLLNESLQRLKSSCTLLGCMLTYNVHPQRQTHTHESDSRSLLKTGSGSRPPLALRVRGRGAGRSALPKKPYGHAGPFYRSMDHNAHLEQAAGTSQVRKIVERWAVRALADRGTDSEARGRQYGYQNSYQRFVFTLAEIDPRSFQAAASLCWIWVVLAGLTLDSDLDFRWGRVRVRRD